MHINRLTLGYRCMDIDPNPFAYTRHWAYALAPCNTLMIDEYMCAFIFALQ